MQSSVVEKNSQKCLIIVWLLKILSISNVIDLNKYIYLKKSLSHESSFSCFITIWKKKKIYYISQLEKIVYI